MAEKRRMTPVELVDKVMSSEHADVVRDSVAWVAAEIMEAEVAAQVGAGLGEVAAERVTQRNGYRPRAWDTRAGEIELRIPKLRSGSYFPSFLEPRRRAEQALVAVVQEAYINGVSTRKVDRLVEHLGTGPASHDRPAPPRGDEGELFARHHAALLRAVRRAVRAPEAVIEDACASAWAILLRRQPDRGPALFGWLRTVAVHEGYRLSGEQRRVSALDDLATVEGEGWEAFVADRRTLEASLEARRALRVLGALPERQRRYLALLAAGYRYQEIARSQSASYTNVNKHLTKARRRIRDLESAA